MFVFFCLILLGVYWVSRIIRVVDRLLIDGQSPIVIFEYFLLLLPPSLLAVLPLASFGAAVYLTDRLFAANEMLVIQSIGVTPAKHLLPFAVFGVVIALIASLLAHELIPNSRAGLSELKTRISTDLAKQTLQAGRFHFPTDDTSLFVQEANSDGEMKSVFLHYIGKDGTDVTYMAEKATLTRSDSDYYLILNHGQSQELDYSSGQISAVQFEALTLDLPEFGNQNFRPAPSIRDFPTSKAIDGIGMLAMEEDDRNLIDKPRPRNFGIKLDPEILNLTAAKRSALLFELHVRATEPFYSLFFPIIGAAMLIFGQAQCVKRPWSILAAVGAIVSIYLVGNYAKDLTETNGAYWPSMYIPIALSAFLLMGLIAGSRGIPAAPRFLSMISSEPK